MQEVVFRHEIETLIKRKIGAKAAMEYAEQFGVKDITTLYFKHVPGRVANQYDKRFNGRDVAELDESRTSPKEQKNLLIPGLGGGILELLQEMKFQPHKQQLMTSHLILQILLLL